MHRSCHAARALRGAASARAWRGAAAAALAAGLSLSGAARAADVFRIAATAGPDTASAGYASAEAALDQLRQASLQALLPSYSVASTAAVSIDYRGLALNTAYPTPGGALLTLDIPRLGISEQFIGATRDESRQLMRDYFKRGDALGRILRALAEVSPADPIAGNPASLQARMVGGSYRQHFAALVSSLSGPALGHAPAPRTAGAPLRLAAAGDAAPVLGDRAADLDPAGNRSVEVDVARYQRAGLSSGLVSLPFSIALPTAPGRPLSLDGELSHADTAGAKTDAGQLGLSYRLPMASGWVLVPSAGVGLTVSRDLGAAGGLVAAALTSAYRLSERADHTLWMGNALHLSRSLRTSGGGYSANPGLHTAALTNGLMLSMSPPSLWSGHWLELSFADTRYAGSALYDRRYDELGLALVHSRGGSSGPATVRAELSWLDTTHSRGWAAKLQLSF